jgi:hypothetical protein
MIPPHELRRNSVRIPLSKWLLWCILVPSAATLVWITVEDLSDLFGEPDFDLRSEASRATAIAYCSVSKSASGFHIVIEEMWKNAPAEYARFVGQSVPFAGGKSSATPDGAVVFFTHPIFSPKKRLHVEAVHFVYKGRIGRPDMSVSELKEICSAPPDH